MSRLMGVTLLCAVAAPLVAQQGPDPLQSRPPLILTVSRAERMEAAVREYLMNFIGAIQRADTVTLRLLVPEAAIPDVEKPVANRAGCASLGAATARLRAKRAGESSHPQLPLEAISLWRIAIDLNQSGDTAARAEARMVEYRRGRIRYAPLRVVFVRDGGMLRAARLPGVLVGLCGMAEVDR